MMLGTAFYHSLLCCIKNKIFTFKHHREKVSNSRTNYGRDVNTELGKRIMRQWTKNIGLLHQAPTNQISRPQHIAPTKQTPIIGQRHEPSTYKRASRHWYVDTSAAKIGAGSQLW